MAEDPTWTVLIVAWPGPELIRETSIDAPTKADAEESARDFYRDEIERGYGVLVLEPEP